MTTDLDYTNQIDYTNQLNVLTANSALYNLRRELARRLVVYFAQWMNPAYIVAPHHDLMGDYLDDIAYGYRDRLVISMPPRHGKSELASVMFAAWWLGNHPDKQVIHISYASGLSNEFSRRIRAMIRDDVRYRELFPGVQLDADRARLDDWKLTAGGGLKSLGVQGGVTGHGADLMIIDDPVKEGDEQSETVLQATYDWYNSAARTRLAPGAAVVIIMTRWHPRDLVGRLLKLAAEDSEADQWDELVLPALAGDDDPLRREPGAALWPDRFSREDLIRIRALSERYFDALFQQSPQDEAMIVFTDEMFRLELATEPNEAVWTFDLASSDNDRSDYNVFCRWSYDGFVLRCHDVIRFRSGWPEIQRRLLDLVDDYPDDRFAFSKHTLELLAFQLIQDERPMLRGAVLQVDQAGDKLERSGAVAMIGAAGRLVVERNGDYQHFIQEHIDFPDVAPHDDCVDASSLAVGHFGLTSVVDVLVGGKVD